jgi:phospholipid/cholesterol/gamma-HCH transport system substrate-binding protein
MPQPRQLSWTQLRVGLLVLVSLTIFAVLIFLMTGEGFFQPRYELRTYMENAAGLRVGDPVRLAGIDAGNVDTIRIAPVDDPLRGVEVVMRVQRRFQDEIREDSEVTIAAEGLLGQRFLNISRGTPQQPAVPPGGVVRMRETADLQDVVETSADVMVRLNRITGRVDNIMAQVESGRGTLGQLIFDDELYRKANQSVDEVNRLIGHAAAGEGSLGRFLMTDEAYNAAMATLNHVDAVVADVRKGEGTLGKFIYDPQLYNSAASVATRADRVVAEIERGQGTLGRLIQDPELYNRANSAIANVDRIGARLDRGEGTAGRLLHDETLYENANAFTMEMRGLLADFRQDPRRFLTIRFRLF